MNKYLLEALRASVFALGATSLVLVVPASAERSQPARGASGQDRDAKPLIGESEYRQSADADNTAPNALAKQPKQGAEEQRADESEGDKISVQQKPAQITVDKPAPKITIEQPQPQITITTQDPKVQVEQEQPRVSVQQPAPQVSVDQAKPEVDVQDAEPNVQVGRQEPRVEVREREAQVDIGGAQSQQRESTQERMSTEQNRQQHQQAQIGQRRSQTQSGQQQGLYELSISDLRSAEVVDSQGQSIGSVAEVVVKQDGSEAGFIISTTGTEGDARHVYRSAEDFGLDGDKLQLNDEAGVEALRKPHGFVAKEFTAVQTDQATLGDIVHRGVSVR